MLHGHLKITTVRGALFDARGDTCPDGQRIIRGMDLFYNGYTRILYAQTDESRNNIMPASNKAARPGASVYDVLFGSALQIEHTNLGSGGIRELAQNRQKYFDRWIWTEKLRSTVGGTHVDTLARAWYTEYLCGYGSNKYRPISKHMFFFYKTTE